MLASIGRSLIIDGEGVFLVDVDQGEVQLLPASQWDIVGGVRPSSWVYILQLQGPTHPEVARASSADVVHVKYSIDPLRPWKGIGPLARASSTGRLAGNLEKSLGQEAGTPVGQLIPIPIDGEDSDSDTDPLADLKADLKSLKGDLGLVETTAAGFGQGRDFAPHGDWQPRRIGASTASGCF